MAAAFCVFDTAIGSCAIAWGSGGIVGAALPDPDRGAVYARVTQRYPGAAQAQAPANVAMAIDGIRAMFSGGNPDLTRVVLDMRGIPDFNRRVYDITRRIPAGATLTYGEVATRLGDAGLSRAVGKALGENPFPPIVPCHRVLSAEGKMHGFSASGGIALKLRMLHLEGWDASQLSLLQDL